MCTDWSVLPVRFQQAIFITAGWVRLRRHLLRRQWSAINWMTAPKPQKVTMVRGIVGSGQANRST